jgi:hypothetical protein
VKKINVKEKWGRGRWNIGIKSKENKNKEEKVKKIFDLQKGEEGGKN